MFFRRKQREKWRPLRFSDQGKVLQLLILNPQEKIKAQVIQFLFEEGYTFVRLAIKTKKGWRIEAFPIESIKVLEEG
ncbi:hypothetical protein H5T58_02735 [Candidatus Parcubacteria bacterium]|nr:hypothetical protein [Candidatus Parcubacteria bacterium]